jgi:hypothetical protein
LAALGVPYQHKQVLQPLEQVQISAKMRDFRPISKLIQIFLSLLAGCDTLWEVNPKLKAEVSLAQAWGWPRFADQSNLSRLLDQLTLKQLEQLRAATTQIWRTHSRAGQHDWRGYLWLDYDLSGLPCSPRAEASQKGYFSEKKSHGTPVSPGECGQVPGNHLVRRVSGQLPYGPLSAAGRVGHRKCFRVRAASAPAYCLAFGWRFGQ